MKYAERHNNLAEVRRFYDKLKANRKNMEEKLMQLQTAADGMYVWMGGWMDGWMEGWRDGGMCRC